MLFCNNQEVRLRTGDLDEQKRAASVSRSCIESSCLYSTCKRGTSVVSAWRFEFEYGVVRSLFPISALATWKREYIMTGSNEQVRALEIVGSNIQISGVVK